jgi:molybdenum cofactor cytidylyltransferase
VKIAGILLAAGNSNRFGTPKLTHPLPDGQQIGIQSARTMTGTVDDCFAIVREQDRRFADQLRRLGFNIVIQPLRDAGMGDSLALGVRATEQADGWLIALADMPWIRQSTLSKVVGSLKSGATLVAPHYRGERGHPVGFGRLYRSELIQLNGDAGARRVLADHPDDLQMLEVDDPGILRDVDRPQDLVS